jgi:hypothetical protein
VPELVVEFMVLVVDEPELWVEGEAAALELESSEVPHPAPASASATIAATALE